MIRWYAAEVIGILAFGAVGLVAVVTVLRPLVIAVGSPWSSLIGVAVGAACIAAAAIVATVYCERTGWE